MLSSLLWPGLAVSRILPPLAAPHVIPTPVTTYHDGG